MLLAIAMLAMEAKVLLGVESGSHTYNTSTTNGGESNKGYAKVYSCSKCKNTFFPTP
jgi:hypothetical protein